MQTTLIIISILSVFLFALFQIASASMKNIPVVSDNDNILTLSDKNFHSQPKNKLVLAVFRAGWYATCRMIAPLLNSVASELIGISQVGKVNIEQYQSLALKYQVRNIPTLVLIMNGTEVNRFMGIKKKEFLLQQINKVR